MVRLSPQRHKIIEDYLSVDPKAREFARTQSFSIRKCVFRDNENKRCKIYPVRPYVCRIFGLVNHHGYGVCRFVKVEKTIRYDPPVEDICADPSLLNKVFGNPEHAEMYRCFDEWMQENQTDQGFLVTTLAERIDAFAQEQGGKSIEEICRFLAEYSDTLSQEELLGLVEYSIGRMGFKP